MGRAASALGLAPVQFGLNSLADQVGPLLARAQHRVHSGKPTEWEARRGLFAVDLRSSHAGRCGGSALIGQHFRYHLLPANLISTTLDDINYADNPAMRLHHVCNNCSTVYAPSLRKCPTKGCRAPRRFSVLETPEQFAARAAERAGLEAFLQELAGAQ